MKTRLIALLSLLLLLGCQPTTVVTPEITGDELLEHVQVLTSEKFAGRGTGTEGYDLAADYVADVFKAIGLQPGTADERGKPSYFQPIPFIRFDDAATASLSLSAGDHNLLIDNSGTDIHIIHPGLNPTSPASIESELINFGPGVVEPEYGVDPLATMDLTGKVVLIDPSPQTLMSADLGLPDSVMNLYLDPLSSTMKRLENAKDAAAVLLMMGDAIRPRWEQTLPLRPQRNAVPAGLSEATTLDEHRPVVLLTWQGEMNPILDAWAETSPEAGIGPMEGASVTVKLDAPGELAFPPNVIAVIPGTDETLADEYVALTAHLDHIGDNDSTWFPGANDNASGVSMLIEVAEALAANPPKRSLLLIALAGEELGFVGARRFVEHPAVPLESIVAEVNLDEVGQMPLSEEGLMLISDLPLQFAVEGAIEASPEMTATYSRPDQHPEYFYRSDQMVFNREGIPSMYITTGYFEGYHSPADNVSTIQPEVMEDVGNIVHTVINQLANADQIDGL